MANVTEKDVLNLLALAAGGIAQFSAIIPVLLANLEHLREGLARDDADALNDQIGDMHAKVQELDARLQELHS